MLDAKSYLCYAFSMACEQAKASAGRVVEFVHPGLGHEVNSIAGYYTLIKELKLRHGEREALCLVGMCAVESSCCGSTSFYYAVVPGYIVNWKYSVNESGLPVSLVEPISDMSARHDLEAVITGTEGVNRLNIEFW